MAKSYVEQLGEWVKQEKSKHRDKNLVAFLAVRDDVKSAVEAGYAVKTIWENMHQSKRLQFGYHTFLNYVNRLIRKQKSSQTTGSEPSKTPDKKMQSEEPEKKKRVPEIIKPIPLPGFTYNSVPPKIEEIF